MVNTIPGRKLRVLQSASKLFSENNFHDVKLDEIATEAKVAKGTIYTYFKSKDELFCQCILNDTSNLKNQTQKIIESEIIFEDKLRKLIEIQTYFYNAKGNLVKQLIQLGHSLKISKKEFEGFMHKLKEGIESLSVFFQLGIDEGVLTNEISATQMAIIFHQIFDINILCEMFNEKKLNQKDTYRFLMKVIKK